MTGTLSRSITDRTRPCTLYEYFRAISGTGNSIVVIPKSLAGLHLELRYTFMNSVGGAFSVEYVKLSSRIK